MKRWIWLLAAVAGLATWLFATVAYPSWQKREQFARKQEEWRKADAEHAARSAEEKAERARLQAWPTLPPGTPPAVGPLPTFPDFESAIAFTIPEERKKDPDIARWALGEMVSRRLRYMLAHHPSPEIHTNLTRDIGAGAIAIELVSLNPAGRPRSYDAIFADTGPEYGNLAVLMIDPESVLYPPGKASMISSDEEILEFMLLITHEGTHYEQWKRASKEGRTLFVPIINAPTTNLPASTCEGKWKAEREAYRASCVGGYAWGVPEGRAPDLCKTVGSDAAFDQALFVWMASSADGRNLPNCLPVFARLAGHPHPEAFSP